jgi:hypothetical protein
VGITPISGVPELDCVVDLFLFLVEYGKQGVNSSYTNPWSQFVVSIGLPKIVKGRWACLPLAFRFYHMKKSIEAKDVKIDGKTPTFQTKFEQAVEMLPGISAAFPGTPLLIVTDSWFGNNGLFKPMRNVVAQHTHILSSCVLTQHYLLCRPNAKDINLCDPESMVKRWAMNQLWPRNFMNVRPTYSTNLYS